MDPMNKKGEGNLYYIVVGALLAIGILYSIKYYHDRDNDITVHIPHVEVH